jgi:hypothetical protein
MYTHQELLKMLLSHEEVAGTDLDLIDPRVRPGWSLAVADAKHRLLTLRKDWKNSVLSHALAIFIMGDSDKAKEFSRIAEEEGNTITLDSDYIYRDIANDIEPLFGPTRQFRPEHLSKLVGLVKLWFEKYGVLKFDPVKVNDFPILNTTADIVVFIKQILRESVGDSLTAMYLGEELAEKAKTIKFNGGTLPVVVLNVTDEEVMGLSGMFSKVGATVNIKNEEITTDLVFKVFKQAKKKLKEKELTQEGNS